MFEKNRSVREEMPPPGQHRSPGCLTLSDRLLSIRQVVLRYVPRTNITDEALRVFGMLSEKILDFMLDLKRAAQTCRISSEVSSNRMFCDTEWEFF